MVNWSLRPAPDSSPLPGYGLFCANRPFFFGGSPVVAGRVRRPASGPFLTAIIPDFHAHDVGPGRSAGVGRGAPIALS